MRDDGFGGQVAKRARERRAARRASRVFDFGTGGLDLAYEVMRGYDALVLVDVSRQGGEPGTLYVMEPDPEEIKPIEDGEVVSPHGMDPQTVLRFVKTVGGWPGKVVGGRLRAGRGRGDGARALARGRGGGRARRRRWCSRRSTSCAPTRPTRRRELMHELSISSAIVDTALRHADGRRVTVVDVRLGALRQVVPESLGFYFEIVSRDTALRGRARSSSSWSTRWMRCDACGREWDPAPEPARRPRARWRAAGAADVPLPGVRARRAPRSCAATSSRSSRSRSRLDAIEEEQCTAPRSRSPRTRSTPTRRSPTPTATTSTAPASRVVNLMSAPGAGKTTLLERGARRASTASAPACSRATSRAAWTPTGSPPCTSRWSSSTPSPGFGGECHLDANMVRSAIGDLPLDELDLLVIENVGNLVCPAEFRVGEDARVMVCLGDRGRGQAAQVPADVPRLRAGRGQQDRPAAAPRLRPRPAASPTSTRSTPARERC